MTSEELFKVLPVLEAMKEGKTIQYRISENEPWCDVTEAHNINIGFCEYRVKPSEQYRPFKDGNECWQEMQKHQPFGWVGINDENNYFEAIQNVFDADEDGENLCVSGRYCTYESVFEDYTFADGTPFGIKEGGEE